MPKSAKKRKDKAADFSKAKLKLGKGKQAASNAIDTSYKARSIALPQQSISAVKDESEPTTRKKLSLENLISHLKHYNAGIRKDALLGFRELLNEHPEVIETSLTDILNSCARVVSDEDASVRKTLHSFMAWLLPLLPPENLVPHSSILLLFTSSAQTHIFPEIRVDAVKFLGLLLEYIPEAVVSGWYDGNGGHGARVLEGYLGLLSAGTKFGGDEGPARATSTASVVLTPSSKLVVLESLASFLGHALSSPNSTRDQSAIPPVPTWFFEASFSPLDTFTSFNRLILPQQTFSARSWHADVDPQTGDDDFVHRYPFLEKNLQFEEGFNTLSDFLNASSQEAEDPKGKQQMFLAQLSQSLHSTLVATYLDCAPTVFSPGGNTDETGLKLVIAVCKICQHIYGAILRSSHVVVRDTLDELKTFLGYMSPQFPFVAHGNRDIKIEQAFQDLNLIYCELNSLLSLNLVGQTSMPTRRNGKQRATPLIETERVCQYVIQLLEGEAPTNSNVSPLRSSLTPAQYSALLPTIWSMLNSGVVYESDLLTSVFNHASRASSKSTIKRSTVEFTGRLVLLESFAQYKGVFRIGRSHMTATTAWVEHLPKALWELGGSNVTCSEIILRVLLQLCQRRSPLVTVDCWTAVVARLAPFFYIKHPQKGELAGPWIKLSPQLRRLALDLVAMVLMSVEVHDVLSNAVNLALVPSFVEGERLYWNKIREGWTG